MIEFLKTIWRREAFYPSYLIGIWINPSFIVRRALIDGLREISPFFQKGKLLDIDAVASLEDLFEVEEYCGIDLVAAGIITLLAKLINLMMVK